MAIIQQQDALSQLPQQLLQILVNEKQMKLEKERVGIARKDQELRAAEFEQEKALQQAQLQGAAAAFQLLMQGRPELQGAAQGLTPEAIPSFMEAFQQGRLGDVQIQGGEITNRLNQSDVTVAEATEGSRIQAAGAQARGAAASADIAESDARVAGATEGTRAAQARASLLDTNLRNEINNRILKGNDPVNGARAVEAWIGSNGQMTWSEASEAVGFTGENGINPDLRFASATQGSAEAVRAAGFYPLMKESADNINRLHDAGVRLTLGGALQKGTRIGSVDALLNAASNPGQRQLIQAQRAFADMYRFSLSGQQSSDAERLAMLLSITEQFGDDDATIAQKRRLRDVMLQVTLQRAKGTMSALDGAQLALDTAKQLGDPEVTAAFQERLDAVNQDIANGVSVSGIPGDNSFSDVPNIVDSALRGR